MDKEKIKDNWYEFYSYLIPTLLVILYGIYVIMVSKGVVVAKLIHESTNFDKMLEALITFISIILSVFGFLIPSFLSGKGETDAINYFLKCADMKLFAAKLKNVVAFGLVDTFLTSILLISDIITGYVLNIIVFVWLWGIFFFMCSSYRFISLMINLLLVQKKKFVQQAANKISEEEIKNVHSSIRNI